MVLSASEACPVSLTAFHGLHLLRGLCEIFINGISWLLQSEVILLRAIWWPAGVVGNQETLCVVKPSIVGNYLC